MDPKQCPTTDVPSGCDTVQGSPGVQQGRGVGVGVGVRVQARAMITNGVPLMMTVAPGVTGHDSKTPITGGVPMSGGVAVGAPIRRLVSSSPHATMAKLMQSRSSARRTTSHTTSGAESASRSVEQQDGGPKCGARTRAIGRHWAPLE